MNGHECATSAAFEERRASFQRVFSHSLYCNALTNSSILAFHSTESLSDFHGVHVLFHINSLKMWL